MASPYGVHVRIFHLSMMTLHLVILSSEEFLVFIRLLGGNDMLLSKFVFIIKRIFLCTTTGRNVNCGNDSSLIKGGSQNPICDKIVKKYFASFRNEKIT